MTTKQDLGFNNAHLYNVIRRPIVSEKSTSLADKNNQYVFEVSKASSKHDIKSAIENIFGVNVESIQVLNVRGKQKQFSQIKGRRNDWKKAYVRLKEGQEINFVGKE